MIVICKDCGTEFENGNNLSPDWHTDDEVGCPRCAEVENEGDKHD
jgi:DNA-directed RNA polymerase subunit RPC12/RpoP